MPIYGGISVIIKCYKPNTLQCFDVITKAKSIIWNKKFYDVGSFELELEQTNLSINDIIYHNGNCGFVTKITKNFDGVTICGFDLKALTNFRYLIEPKTYSGNFETVVKAMANDLLMTDDRAIYGMTIELDQHRGPILESQEYANVYWGDLLKDLGEQNEISYDIVFDGSKFIFKVLIGEDRTKTLTFSRNFKNLESCEYVVDASDVKNVAVAVQEIPQPPIVYYVQEYDEDGNPVRDEEGKIKLKEIQEEQPPIIKYVSVGTDTGFLRKEFKVDNLDDAEKEIKNNVLSESLRGEANDKLQYMVDWNIGDYVTVVFDDIITEKQITEVKEVHEPSNNKIIPIFGEEKENIIKKIIRGEK